ncbi:transport acessory protein MmpS [Mycobacterium sp. M1]|uniref:Transport acessory protein MmpS n=1 Tax=Mycolicibacter acidiphilus TaxID=2835306 RepID=A0ABS5RGF6_9MYCO|nr:MmpS family transport accessory protein [Mycolicibacter acidiphilus]MBS9533370.1 transport acessory protein MmpS [Mycolicibacter acidiphilus]
MRKVSVAGALKRHWIPVVFIIVIAISSVVVTRLHKVFASQDLNPHAGAGIEIVQFNPKYVAYEAFGPPGTTADINYWDAEANVHQLNNVPLPWSFTVVTVLPAVMANMVVQGNTNEIGCRIKIDDRLRDERRSTGLNAQTFCLVKSG